MWIDENFPDLYRLTSGAEPGVTCVINRNIEHFEAFRPHLGKMLIVTKLQPNSEKAFVWQYLGASLELKLSEYESLPCFAVPDCILTAMLYTEGPDETLSWKRPKEDEKETTEVRELMEV